VRPVHARTNAKLYKHNTQKSVLDRYWTVGLQLIHSTGPVRSTRRWTVRSLQLVLLKVQLIILLCGGRTEQRFVMSRSFQMNEPLLLLLCLNWVIVIDEIEELVKANVQLKISVRYLSVLTRTWTYTPLLCVDCHDISWSQLLWTYAQYTTICRQVCLISFHILLIFYWKIKYVTV